MVATKDDTAVAGDATAAATRAAQLAAAAQVADQERRDAAALVVALENRLRGGDLDVDVDEIASARKLADFARLRAQGAAANAEAARTAARLAACVQLRDEIENHAGTAGDEFASLLKVVAKAARAFRTAADRRNETIAGWAKRMQDLEVPLHATPMPIPPDAHGNLGIAPHPHGGRALAAGRRRVQRVDATQYLEQLVRAIEQGDDQGTDRLNALYTRLAGIDQTLPDPDPTLRFFRGSAGAVVVLSPAQIDAPAAGGGESGYARQIRTGELVEITRAEAWGA